MPTAKKSDTVKKNTSSKNSANKTTATKTTKKSPATKAVATAKTKTVTQLPDNIVVSYKLYDVTDVMAADIEKTVAHNIAQKMDAYFTKALGNKKDAIIRIDIKINYTKQSRYEGKMNFVIDGKWYGYHTSSGKPFKNVLDLVAHGFDHLKAQLANAK